MFRGTLEAVVRDRGSDAAKKAAARNLASALRVMAEDGGLHPQLADWAEEIKLGGNAGAHLETLEPVTQREAEDLGRLLRELLKYLYELPAGLNRSRIAGSTTPKTS